MDTIDNKKSQTKGISHSFSENIQKINFTNNELENKILIESSNKSFSQPKISIVIPCLNEEAGLKFVLPQIHEVMDEIKLPYEVIIIDDGSNDNTAEIAKKYYANVLINLDNRGKGFSLQRGFNYAEGDIIITMDGDGTHKPEDIPRLIEPILGGQYELVIGSRFLNTADNNTTNLLRTIGNKIFNYLIWFLTGKRLTDSQSGFRAFSKKLLRIMGTLHSKGYELESEFIIKSIKLIRNKILEIPIKTMHRLDGTSRIRIIRDSIKIFKKIIQATFSNSKNFKS